MTLLSNLSSTYITFVANTTIGARSGIIPRCSTSTNRGRVTKSVCLGKKIACLGEKRADEIYRAMTAKSGDFVRKPAESGQKDKFPQVYAQKVLFYYEYIDGTRHGSNYWKSMLGTPKYNTWCGLAFERTCLWHVEQIKKKLGISGILTNEYAWRCTPDEESDSFRHGHHQWPNSK